MSHAQSRGAAGIALGTCIGVFIALISVASAADARTGEAPDAVAKFTYSDAATEDRNHDGHPDLWRRFTADGSLQEISFDSTQSRGIPDLIYLFEGKRKWTRRTEMFREGPLKRVTTTRLSAGPHGDFLRIEEEGRDGKTRVIDVEPLADGAFRMRSQGRAWEEGGPDSTVRFYDSQVSQCLAANPLAKVKDKELQAILHEIDGGTVLADTCEKGLTLKGAKPEAKFADKGAVKKEMLDIINTGMACLRGLKDPGGKTFPQANRLADEFLVNAFANAGKRGQDDKFTVDCSIPDEKRKTAYAMATDVTKPNFPRVFLNEDTLSGQNFRQTVFHELMHMTGGNGRPHIHDYNNPNAPDVCQACAACCFDGDTSVDAGAAQFAGAGISNLAALKAESCKVCSGQYTPLSRQQIGYAKTELVQGNNTSYAYAAFELRKAVINEPGNAEGWLLLAKASRAVKPRTVDREFRALEAYRQARALAKTDAERAAIDNDADYKSLQEKLKKTSDSSGMTMFTIRGYMDANQYSLDSKLVPRIMDLEAERQRLRIVLQSCGDFASGGNCDTQAKDALAAYKEKAEAFINENNGLKGSSSASYAGSNIVKAEYQKQKAILTCLQGGGKTQDQCFLEAYGNPDKKTPEYQDWFVRP